MRADRMRRGGVAPGGVPAGPMLAGCVPADLRDRLATARLYLCTDARERNGDLPDFLDAVLGAGVDVIQLRQKGLDVAYAVGADVLHLGQDDLPVGVAREILGPGPLIGLSSHAEAETSRAAAADGVDYFCVGPVWPTPTKPGRPAPGLALLRYAATIRTPRPWFAIGGIGLASLGEVLEAGARRIVVVRAITEADDPARATADLVARLPAIR